MSRPSLYDLMPAIYRRRDRELTGDGTYDAAPESAAPPLEAIFSILQTQFDALENEIADLYDDWFVETCSPEALPVLAEPFAFGDLSLDERGTDIRSLVANIVRYRQAKGTAWAFSGFASDATGWTVLVSDGSTTQATSARLDSTAQPTPGFASVRRFVADDAPRSFEFRKAFHGSDVATISVWRASSVLVRDAEPYRVTADGTRRLFNPAGAEVVLMQLAEVGSNEVRLRATIPHTREGARALVAAGRTEALGFAVRDAARTLTLRIEDLSRSFPGDPGAQRRRDGVVAPPLRADEAIVDPELGRVMVSDDRRIWVDYRPITLDGIGAVPTAKPWGGRFDKTFVVTTMEHPPAPPESMSPLEAYTHAASLQDALDAAAADDSAGFASVRIVLADSGTMRADEWRFAPALGRRTLTIETAPGCRPALIGNVRFEPAEPSRVTLRGLLVRGCVVAGARAAVTIERSTLRGEVGARALVADPSPLVDIPLVVRSSMVDAITMGVHRPLDLADTIVIGATVCAASLTARRATFIEAVVAQTLTADDAVFNRSLLVDTAHAGYVRFCLLPPGARTPTQFACTQVAQQMLASGVAGRPRFARLNERIPAEVRNGGSEGWEIGAFAHYAENKRMANLNRAIAEFLPDTASARIEFRS